MLHLYSLSGWTYDNVQMSMIAGEKTPMQKYWKNGKKKFEFFFLKSCSNTLCRSLSILGAHKKFLKHTFLVVYAKVTSFRTTSRIFFRVPIQKFWKNYLADFDNFFCDDSKMSSEEAFYWSLLEINFLLHFFSLKSDTEETNTDI